MGIRQAVCDFFILGKPGIKHDPLDFGQVHKILVVRTDNIGDVLCTTAALTDLRQAFPKAHIAMVVCSFSAEAVSGHEALDQLYVYPKAIHRQHGFIFSWWRLGQVIWKIRKEKYDLALSFRSNFSRWQAWIPYAGKVRWRVGVRAQDGNATWEFFISHPVEAAPQDLHEVLRCGHVLRQINIPETSQEMSLTIPLKAMAKVHHYLAGHGLRPDDGFMLLHMSKWSYSPDRNWPDINYKTLIKALAGNGDRLILVCAPNDFPWASRIVNEAGSVAPLFCSGSLKELAGLISCGKLMIVVEGGAMHVAAAVNTPLVVLWGDKGQSVWRPWQVRHTIVGAGKPLASISADEVLAAAQSMLIDLPS